MTILVDESTASTLTNWTDNSGAAFASGVLTLSSGDYYAKHDTELPDDCWFRYKIRSSQSSEYLIVKSSATVSGFIQFCGYNGTSLDMSFYEIWDGTAAGGSWEENSPAENSITYASSQFLGITLETSTDTMSVWVNPSNATPYDLDNWDSASDAADYSWTCVKDLSTTGGSWGLYAASNNTCIFSDITAGDFESDGNVELDTKSGAHDLASDEVLLAQTHALQVEESTHDFKSDTVTVSIAVLQTVTLNLVNVDNDSQNNLTGLRWAWFDESDVESMTTPTDQGSVETTDGSGELIISLSFTALTTGQFGLLALQTSDDVASALYRIAID